MSRVLVDIRKFFDSPTIGEFEKLQQQVLESNDYDPSATQLQQTEISLATQSPTHALQALSELSDDYLICPRFHYVEARIREILGEVAEMRESIERLRACIRAIVETGDGSQESPFKITFLTDADDVVLSMGERKRCQQPVLRNGKQLDVITAHSGVEFWFDVTKLAQRVEQNANANSANEAQLS